MYRTKVAVPAKQRTGFRPDTPGNEILVGKILVLGTAEIQLFRIGSGGTVAGAFPEESIVDAVGIDPAGGTHIGLTV